MNVLEKEKQKKKKIATIFAYIALVIIALILCSIAYALFTKNGMLALAMTIVLIFVSINFWFIIGIYKRMMKKYDEYEEENKRRELLNFANMKTKDIGNPE